MWSLSVAVAGSELVVRVLALLQTSFFLSMPVAYSDSHQNPVCGLSMMEHVMLCANWLRGTGLALPWTTYRARRQDATQEMERNYKATADLIAIPCSAWLLLSFSPFPEQHLVYEHGTGLNDCLNMLLSCSRKRMSALLRRFRQRVVDAAEGVAAEVTRALPHVRHAVPREVPVLQQSGCLRSQS